MSNMIEMLAEQLQEVNNTIVSISKIEDVTFDNALTLVHFYDDFKNTNEFIDEVEQRAHENVGALLVSVTRLQGLIRRFLSLDLAVWREVDFVALERKHLRAYQDKWNKAKEKSTKLLQKYQSESNRLDMMDFTSEEYQELDFQCEETKDEYEDAQEKTDRYYTLLKLEQESCVQVHYFEMQFLELWASKMLEITEAVRSDAKRLLKGGNA